MKNGQHTFPVLTPENPSNQPTMVVVAQNTNDPRKQKYVTSVAFTNTACAVNMEEKPKKQSAPSMTSLPAYEDAVRNLEQRTRQIDIARLQPMPPSYGECSFYDITSDSEAEDRHYFVSVLAKNDQ